MNSTTGNQKLIKQINKNIVLQSIKNQGPISRADISQNSGLNKGTVSSLVSELIDQQLIYECGIGQSKGGRRPVMLLFNETAGYNIGIDLGVNYILGILTDLQGQIVQEKELRFPEGSKYDDIIKLLFEVIQDLIQSGPESVYGIVGIGIGVPGIVSKEGKVLMAPNLEWKDIHLKEIVEQEFNIPVIIDNEANAGAYGEKHLGAGKDYQNIVYVSAGIGIGVGLILKNSLYRGLNGYAGEFGHMKVEMGGTKCRCGSQGCWEMYASEHTLLKEAKSHYPDENLSLESIVQQAENGDATAIHLFEKIGKYLGFGISNLINSFNPEQVILGNRLVMARKWIEPEMKKNITMHSLRFHLESLQLDFSKKSVYSAALGVSTFTAENFLSGKESM
ncbi:ROK family protein (putative glucokinase) [Salinibacillus kushneri]|uniref:ROK family protein (Putative glucokinase) n=1 Tax=Salinibacillus kushneri TaxID=237682 RepID=A0A1I0GNU0_9BACI|nr:ROK family transcriptional regulator [Salinibacillus kushneri]SET71817.1 ROK family protein (putative glucokinase) [Salinibacillus kushneri]